MLETSANIDEVFVGCLVRACEVLKSFSIKWQVGINTFEDDSTVKSIFCHLQTRSSVIEQAELFVENCLTL